MTYIIGRIDEYADFSTLLQAKEPLKLNLSRVTGLNSIGVRRFLELMVKWGKKELELHECVPDFIGNASVIPQMLGVPPNKNRLKSLFVPYTCDGCKTSELTLIKSPFKLEGNGGVILPHPGKCQKCGEELNIDVDIEEYFGFLRIP